MGIGPLINGAVFGASEYAIPSLDLTNLKRIVGMSASGWGLLLLEIYIGEWTGWGSSQGYHWLAAGGAQNAGSPIRFMTLFHIVTPRSSM
jgi:hypothetical protein